MLGTPASNFCGNWAQVASVIVTESIIDPPKRNGDISFNNSSRPQSTPTPVGPNILWPEKAMKSTSNSFTSTLKCGTDWHASSTRIAPTALAATVICFKGVILPKTFD